MSFEPSIWIGAICTLVILSFVYKENPVYRFFEHVFVGLGVGYGVGLSWTQVLKPYWWDKLAGVAATPVSPAKPGSLWWLLVLIPGSMWYFQFSKKYVWISRLIIGFFMGFGATSYFEGAYGPMFGETGQITQSLKPLWSVPSHLGGLAHADNVVCALTGGWLHISAPNANYWIFLMVLISCVSYFFFSFRPEKHPVLQRSMAMGRMFFMVCFGAIFGNTIMGRLSLLLERLEFLMRDWLKLIN